MNKVTLKYLRRLLNHAVYYNKMTPFPIYETLWVQEIKDKIKLMKYSKEDYDEEPVVACKYCKNLHIVKDEVDNNICYKCGSINEVDEFKNIFEYQQSLNNK